MSSNSLFTAIVAVALLVIFLIIGMAIIIIIARKQKISQQLKEAQLQARINDANLAALSSQMNPHFIFNCLNSIRLYAEQNNVEAAGEYLSMFAQLIRNTLHNARREKILLQDELDSMGLYLKLEAMRFKEKLKYQIVVDDNVDVDFVEIPPMLVQPYIENAIWHGLMHKEDGGTIRLHFKQSTDDVLIVTVEDNGVGRQNSANIKWVALTKQKSYGTQITSERIALINEKYHINATVQTTDLRNNKNEPCGTLVTLKIPLNELAHNSNIG